MATTRSLPARSMVVIAGASASSDSVRRALWLPRRADARRPLGDVLRAATRPGSLAITQHDGYVLVHGLSALGLHRDWCALSADGCRVFAFLLVEGAVGSAWTLYESGRRLRAFDERNGRDEGERPPYEPPPDRDELPAERIRALYTALTEREVGAEVDAGQEVDVWFVRAPRPPGAG